MGDKILKITEDNRIGKNNRIRTSSITHKNWITLSKSSERDRPKRIKQEKKSGHKCKDLTTTNFDQNSNCKQVTSLLLTSATIH